MAITTFDEVFLKKNKSLIESLMTGYSSHQQLLDKLSKKHSESSTWFRNVRSHLAISERQFQNSCINV